jgi:hypothetical protein
MVDKGLKRAYIVGDIEVSENFRRRQFERGSI